ncbi:NUDIX hydrolase [Saccharothrix algeriensis]|uniref:8-oxo-dGTP pyrophosphatase MutT (NUDIX family) n=1 Tax=Saccharothrix algeriensis TaxID=173560 RepID=A0A8T8I468_9PSEU|nr:8-oxo-dGTP pyrophosphatase MutT (NUDIX family) [Saccharothrix algeriensis]QTR05615.1 NUDIX domain-containing protein [Saccharothrix algeriensis]
MRELPQELLLPPGLVPDVAPAVPATPRDAATVMLLRDGDAGVEVFLQRRVLGMAFAGGMTVFPGGGVDPRDADASVAWAGPPPEWWAERFACSPELARALVCAAVRETFEESGVLLAGPSADSAVADTAPFTAARAALVARELSLAGFLADRGLVLRADLLRPWANWVTPPEEPRRYDTRFFVAVLPGGQRADGWTTEASDAVWQTPAQALADWRDGRRMLMPPTWVALSELAGFRGVADVLVAERVVDKIIPKVVRDGDEVRVVLP